MTPRSRPVRMTLAMTIAVAALLSLAGAAVAHAELVEVAPEAGSTVEGTPSEIAATFSEALETEGTSFTLRDDAGDDIASGGIDPEDGTRLVIDALPDLAAGEYEVFWVAASDDGHIERDTWTFTVEAAATAVPTPIPTVTSAPSVATSDAPSASPSTAPSPSQELSSPSAAPTDPADPPASTSDILIPIIVLAALIGIGMTYFLRRRRGPTA